MKSCELLNALVVALTVASAQIDEAPEQTVIQPVPAKFAEARAVENTPRTARRSEKLSAPVARAAN